MTYDEAKAFCDAAEANFYAACAIYKQAAADVKRSKSAKNRAAFVKAQENREDAAAVFRRAQDRLERAATVERRKALVVPRAAQRAAQGSLL